MTLLLTAKEVAGLLDPAAAIEVTEAVVREEAAGTTVHMAPFGGLHSGGRDLLRVVGGGLLGMRRMGLRAGLAGPSVALIYDTDSWSLLAIVGYPFSRLRVGAAMALAVRYLSRPDARSVGLLGSGANALTILQCLCAVRPIERIDIYSPTPEHRRAFAQRASAALEIPVTARETPEPVIEGADIIAVATNSISPVLTAEQLRPGVHVTSMGLPSELDASIYLGVDQFVASSVQQEIEGTEAERELRQRPIDPLHQLLADGRLRRENIVELGAIVTGRVPVRNGPSDTTLFRESRGGVGDIALAHFAYERARERGLGVEFNFG